MTAAAVPTSYVLLGTDDQGGSFAVGPFRTAATAQQWEEHNPQHADDIGVLVPVYGPSRALPVGGAMTVQREVLRCTDEECAHGAGCRIEVCPTCRRRWHVLGAVDEDYAALDTCIGCDPGACGRRTRE